MRGKLTDEGRFTEVDGITPAGAGKTRYRLFARLQPWDHPRRCGENGNRRCLLPKKSRITPAGAGKTVFCQCCLRRPRDHPRRCGENSLNGIFSATGLGSPPQVRGKRADNWYRGRCSRITPAGAGKTLILPTRSCAEKDHPRRCGENGIICTLARKKTGSPPQVRGKHRHAAARARTPRDHPRRCGENRPAR